MKPGTVIHHKNFPISDGNIADKLLVILNFQRGGEFLALLTTSQQRNRQKLEGCQSDLGYYFCPANINWFEKDTWILLYETYSLSRTELENAEQTGIVKIMQDLDEQLTSAIINCFKKSDDCSDHHLWLLA